MSAPRAVVIGAGLGGLACAVRLLAAGFAVTIVEQAPTPGGRAGHLCEAGYRFDLGPSLLTLPELLADLFAVAGSDLAAELRLRPLDPFYRISWQGERRRFLFTGEVGALREQVARFDAGDADRLAAYLEASRRIYVQAIVEAGHRPFLRVRDFAPLVPTMVRLGALRSVERFVARYFREPHVRQAFGFHPLFIGGDPARVPAVYAALAYLQIAGGVWYVEGGIWSVVQVLSGLVRRGGEILLGQRAIGIDRRGGRVFAVRLEGGEQLPAEVVVSNADVSMTRRLAGLPPYPQRASMSCFLLYLGTNRKFPQLDHHTLLVGPGYREFIDWTTRRRTLASSLSLYVHAPSRTEPAMAAPGGESISVLLPVPNLAARLRWPEVGDLLRERVFEALESPEGLALEGLRRSIVVEHRFTPLDFRDRLGARLGHAFGPEPLLRQSALFRQHNRYRTPRGLYQVGSGTHPGAGIPGVLLTAEVTAGLVVNDWRQRMAVFRFSEDGSR
jgi:phytoene desaturase